MFEKIVLAGALLLFGSQVGFHPVASFAASNGNPSNTLAAPAAHVTPAVPGVVYVKFKAGSRVLARLHHNDQAPSITRTRWDRAVEALGMLEIVPFDAHAPKDDITRSLGIDRMFCLYYKDLTVDPHTALQQLLATGEVENGSARYTFPISKNVNDPLADQEYALNAMKIFNAWDHTVGDTSVIIADVDCAINIDHEDLTHAVKINWGEVGLDKNGHDKRTNGIDDDGDGVIDDWGGVDVVGAADRGTPQLVPDGDPRPDNDQMNHGTETAGCISATADNGLGVAGVAYGCKLLAIKASDNGANIVGGYEGIHWATTHGARIVNCSWGGGILATELPFANTLLHEAVSRNALIVAAAGNNTANNDLFANYPANGPGVLSVGATTAADAAAAFSDFGKSVSVWAPGEAIYTTGYPGNSFYTAVDGTSFASPLTAGVAGLITCLHPGWPMKFIARQIIESCDNVISPTNRANYWGRVNAQSAIENAPVGPGLILTSYAVNGVVSDSIGLPGVTQDLVVNLKNVVADGTNLSARVVPVEGVVLPKLPTPIGSIAIGATSAVSFTVTRSPIFSEGVLPVRIAVTDNNLYVDTLTVFVPLKKLPGFTLEDSNMYGSSIIRTSNTAAWAAYGFDQGTVVSEFGHESGGIWDPVQGLASKQAVYCVEAIDSQSAWFGASASVNSTNPGCSVISTNDGGASWTTADVHAITPFVNSIHFFDDQNGIFIGDPMGGKWGIGITTDAGTTWKASTTRPAMIGAEASWNNAAAWVGKYGWYGTNNGRIYRTADRGHTWKSVVTPFTHSLALAFASDSLHGMACFRPAGSPLSGKSGLASTLDGGQTWASLAMPADTMIPIGVRFVPGSTTAFVSFAQGMYRTSDYGATWSIVGIPSSVYADITDMAIYRGQGMFSVSLISQSGGIATYHEAMADPMTVAPQATNSSSIQVFQNSPNPLRDASTIFYEMPRREYVRLAVYDAVGREVASLVNGMVDPGVQSAVFHAENLTPGVYYYMLSAEDGTHITRAMTILK